MAALSSSSALIIRHIFRSPPLSSISVLKQTTISLSLQPNPLRTFFFSSLSSSSPIHSLSSINFENPQTPVVDDDFESEIDNTQNAEPGKEDVTESDLNSAKKYEELVSKLPSLSVKEKKELASYAHSLGKKLKSQQVGKSGVTDSVATALVETLEANELLKVKVHSNSPVELDEVVKQLEGATRSVVVGRIGRTVILYRPSLTKLKAEEKKIQARKIFVRRQQAFKSSLQNKAKAFGQSGAGRGRSRF